MGNLFTFIPSHKFVIVGLALLAVGGYALTNQPKQSPFETVVVKQGIVIQEVSVTGRVNSGSLVDLAFEKSGRVVSEPRQVGEHVKKDAVLVRLDASEISALRAQAQANLDVEIIRLSEIKRGTRVEDIAVSEAAVKSALASLNDSEATYWDKSELAFNAIQDAIYVKTDVLFYNPRSSAPKMIAPIADQNLITTMEQERVAIGNLFPEGAVIGEKTDLSNPSHKEVAITKELMSRVKNYLDNLAGGVSSILPSSQTSQATIDGWKANVGLARTSVSSAYSALLAADEKRTAAEKALELAKSQLNLKKAPATEESIGAQEARIRGLEATLINYDAQIAKTLLRAPFAGVITKQEAKLGEAVSPNIPVVTLMSDGKWKIEANVPEADVARVHVGNIARLTFDAYGTDVFFMAKVVSIDPAETVVGGVSTYKITLHLDQDDERVRSGMTANIDINTDKREGVLVVPTRAITTKDGAKYVRVTSVDLLTAREVLVEVGLRGSDGYTEIRSGVSEGERIVLYDNTP